MGWHEFFFTPLLCCCFWIRDPRSGIRDKHPGSATLVYTCSLCTTRRWRRMRRRWRMSWTARRRGCDTRRTISPLFRSGIRCRPSLHSYVFCASGLKFNWGLWIRNQDSGRSKLYYRSQEKSRGSGEFIPNPDFSIPDPETSVKKIHRISETDPQHWIDE